jgi:predicted RNase H-like HicB family nuclease
LALGWALRALRVTISSQSHGISFEAKEPSMSQTYTAIIKNDEGSWIGWIEEVPGVNCQESTREALLESLRITLIEALEFNRADARDAACKGYEELLVAI